jgi:hypothetical protein
MYWLARYLTLPAWAVAGLHLWLARPLGAHRRTLRLYARMLIAHGLLIVLMLTATLAGALVAGAVGAFAQASPEAMLTFAVRALLLGWAGAGSLMAGYPLLRACGPAR